MEIEKDLVQKIRTFARSGKKVLPSRRASARTVKPLEISKTHRIFTTQNIKTVVIGASTGGPSAVQKVLAGLPAGLKVSFLVVVHMPAQFTTAFAERLNGICQLSVREAKDKDEVLPGRVLICPGGLQTRNVREGVARVHVQINNEPARSLYKPAINESIKSVASCFNGRTMGVILTGMGDDGMLGMREIKRCGGKTLVQNESSCTVYGMPKAVIGEGLADKVVPLDMIAAEIVNMI